MMADNPVILPGKPQLINDGVEKEDEKIKHESTKLESSGVPGAPLPFKEGEIRHIPTIAKLFEHAMHNMAQLTSDALPSLGSTDLLATLTSDIDMPNLVHGVKTVLRVSKFNDSRTVVLYEDYPTGKKLDIMDVKAVIVELFSSIIAFAKSRYEVIADVDTVDIGNYKVVKPGTHGFDYTQVADGNFGMINSMNDLLGMMRPVKLDHWRARFPAILTEEEGRCVNEVYGLIFDQAQVDICNARMRSMELMMTDHDGINMVPPERIVGEIPLAMADGENSQLWDFPLLGPTLTRTGLSLTFPHFSTFVPNTPTDTVGVRASSTRVNVASAFANIEMSSELGVEMSCVIAAMLYPEQIRITVTDVGGDEATSVVDWLGALFSKFFLSTTPGMANVERSTAEKLDFYARNIIMMDGCVRAPHGTMNFTNKREWNELSTLANSGDGWINHHCTPADVIRLSDTVHGYVRGTRIARWARVAPSTRVMASQFQNEDVRPPILESMMRILTTGKLGDAQRTLSAIVNLRADAYRALIQNLNGYIRDYCFNSFRIPTEYIIDPDRRHNPVYFTVRPRVFVAMWKFMPCRFVAPQAVSRLPVIESRIDAEMQVFSNVLARIFDYIRDNHIGDIVRSRAAFRLAARAVDTPFIAAITAFAVRDPGSEFLPNRNVATAMAARGNTSPFARFLTACIDRCMADYEDVL